MAKKNFYGIILTDGTREIVKTWPECQSLLKRCPSGARYKGFPTLEGAQAFIQDKPTQAPSISQMSGETAIAYVDGSFNSKTNMWGYGVVLYDVTDESSLSEYSGSGAEFISARNVTGEVYGAMRAAEEAIRKGFRKIVIHHDYEGIEAWATGRWRALQPLTREYLWTMEDYQKQIKVEFVKVAAHTGVKYNEKVDILAKKAAGIM